MPFFQLSLLNLLGLSPKKIRTSRRVSIQSSVPELQSIWNALCAQFFPGRDDLLKYSVVWSRRRQRRVLASCNIQRNLVAVAKELDTPDHAKWLEPLLYHELCHAVIGMNVQKSRGKRRWHGREFRSLEHQHPQIAALDEWIKSGGWAHAVRSARSKASYAKRVRKS